jgi:hypothetical protein
MYPKELLPLYEEYRDKYAKYLADNRVYNVVSLVHLGFFNTKGWTYGPTSGPCYSAFTYSSGGSDGHVSLLKNNGFSEEDQRLFLTWMIKESPYKDCFVFDDIDYILKHRVIVTHSYIQTNLSQGALCHIRQLWESIMIIKGFLALAKAGMNKNLAFLLGHMIYVNENFFDTTEGTYPYHQPFSCEDITTSAVVNFVAGNLGKNKKRPINKEDPSYQGNTDVFSDKPRYQGQAAQKIFQVWVDGLLVPKTSTNNYKSPFSQVKPVIKSTFPLESLKVLAERENEFIKLCGESNA